MNRLGFHRGLAWLGLLLSILIAAPVFANDTVYYYYTDTLHSAVVETDAQGNVIERTYYGPYGLVLDRTMRDGPGYGGHEEDPATGLNYMQQRYYDPQAGRFVSSDPVLPTEDGGNFNRYWYANDNPYRYTDPDGRSGTAFLGGLFYESWSFITGHGFHGSQIVGALKDGYNGEGGGRLHAVLEDANTVASVLPIGRAAEEGATVVKGAYEAATAGGKHAGFLRNYAGKSVREIKKAIQSIEKQISTHEAKIANPEKEMPGFGKLDPRQQKALVEKEWPSDIKRQKEQADVLRGLLNEKHQQ